MRALPACHIYHCPPTHIFPLLMEDASAVGVSKNNPVPFFARTQPYR